MVFSSLFFLFLFLPLCLGVYFLVPSDKGKNAVLIAASLIFYAWGEPVFVLLLVASAAANYGFGRLIEHYRGARHHKLLLAAAVTVDLGVLVFFKYAGLLTETVNGLFSLSLPVAKLALPIGISFYTFQTISYVVDVYRGDVRVQKNFWRYLLYLSLFPQLIAGPIVRYSQIEPQLEHRAISRENIFYGALRFFVGLGKKVLIANYAGKAASMLLDGSMQSTSVAGAWLGVILFAFEIYFDFSGYSDMAIGLGRIFGFKYDENFDLPYTSSSITEFWRRWHISLGSFFRDYVYIPMGGNRRHQLLNLLVVWGLTGLWHGASWNFALWGLYFFVLLYVEKRLKKPLSHVPTVIRRILTLFFVALGWTLFYYTDLTKLWAAVTTMFTGPMLWQSTDGITLLNNLPLLILCILGSTRLPRMLGLLFGSLCAVGEPRQTVAKERLYVLLVFVFDLAVLALSVISLVGSSYNPFLYFRF